MTDIQHQPQQPIPGLPDPFRAPPQRSKLRKQITITLAVGAGMIVLVVVLALLSLHPVATKTHEVLYEATADSYTGGGRSGLVTAQTVAGTTQGTGLLPFSDTIRDFHRGDFVYISVQNQQPAGSVTCRITVDGTVVSENTSTGAYAIATCQGKVP